MIGGGYVGLVSGACFAEFGTEVTVVETDAQKLAALCDGRMPIYEPGLEQLVQENVKAGRLAFTGDLAAAVDGTEAVFIAVGTPTRRGDGHADLTYVYAAAEQVARALTGLRGDRDQIDGSGWHRAAHSGNLCARPARTPSSMLPRTRNFCARATRSATSCGRTVW